MGTAEVVKRAIGLSEPFLVADGSKFHINDVDPGDTLDFKSEDKPRAREALANGVQALTDLQDMLYAQDRWALLVTTLKDRTRLAYDRYYGGVSNLLEALDADRDQFQAELALAQTVRDELLSVVQLYKALGGGWQQ